MSGMTDAPPILRPPTSDVLGEPWQQRRILLAPRAGYDRRPEAVLVNQPPEHRRAVLYLHGFTDYFFQAAHAERWREAGFDFYALDMRMSGRAIRGRERPGDVRNLRHHDEEIQVALETIQDEGHEQVVLLGHSTGGLIAVSFADRHPGQVDAIVLNSPWFDHNGPWVERVLLTPVVRALAKVAPSLVVGHLKGQYGRSLHVSTGGEWDYDLHLKPLEGFPMRAGMFASVRREQARLARGLHVQEPVLLCCSTRSATSNPPTPEELRSTDCVLDVRHMVERGPMVGHHVALKRFEGGIHDLALSRAPVRDLYERTVIGWATRRLDSLDR